jgi:hypothetical protein
MARPLPEDFLHSIWSSRLPTNVQAIIAGQPEGDLNAAARCADRITEVSWHLMIAALRHSTTATHFSSVSRTSLAM